MVVVGFPSNDFANQEPGTNEEIKEFVKNKYSVTFPISQKISVKGDNIDPFFKYIVSEADKLGITNPIKWNFTKFLFDENGNLLEVFPSKIAPLSQDIIKYLK